MAKQQSAFDPARFLQSEVTGVIFDTTHTPYPEGEYNAILQKVDAGRLADGNPYLDVTWQLVDVSDDVVALMGKRDTYTMSQRVFLEVDANGGLATGTNKNIQLGKILAAVGLNGKTWGPKTLEGRGPVKLTTKNRPDKDNPELQHSRVVNVS